MFDQLLYLRDGKTVYCGNVGSNSQAMIRYLENHGARHCRSMENPAEWLFDVTRNLSVTSSPAIDWHAEWSGSPEREALKASLTSMVSMVHPTSLANERTIYATSFWTQFVMVTRRNLTHDWRTPSYLWSKFFLIAGLVCSREMLLKNYANDPQGSSQWLFLLSSIQLSARHPESNILSLHSDDNLQQCCPDNHAPVHRQQDSL